MPKTVKLNAYVFMDVRVILCLSNFAFRDEVLHKSGELLLNLSRNQTFQYTIYQLKSKVLSELERFPYPLFSEMS